MSKIAYTIDEAAEEASVSTSTIRRAINATDPTAFPPPLRAKRTGGKDAKKFEYRILHTALEAWVHSWRDA